MWLSRFNPFNRPAGARPLPTKEIENHIKIKIVIVTLAAVFALAGATAQATILSTVPMQGPMVHIGIHYMNDGLSTNIEVDIEPMLPTLTPLTLSHPGDQFDHTDPWFADLAPSAGGAAFNRQYGFVLDGLSDPLPLGQGIWIRQVSATPGLKAFTYRTSPDTWMPMFGTDGSSDTLQWNLGMFHPAYTAPADIGTYFATYEAFVVDGGIPTGIMSDPFTIQWEAIPEPTTGMLTLFGVGITALTARRRKH